MTIRNVVSKLRQEGYKVTYRVRKDGGVLIKSINGQKFKGATGNTLARQLSGETISESREIQLRYATVKRKWIRGKLPTKKNIGDLSYKRTKRVAMEEGKEAVFKYLSEKEKYAAGIAYTENVRLLKVDLERLSNIYEMQELQDLADEIWNNAEKIRDEWLVSAYEVLYEINGKNANIDTVTRNKVLDVIARVKEKLRL